ncbi:MAG TPA: hypothetical protein VGN80_07695 [Devosiaceae bacterium]|nr:hypothetical protein [Devosiaceae bacterium]
MARTTLLEALARLALQRRLNAPGRRQPRPAPAASTPSQPRSIPMNFGFLDGYKTYVVAAAMVVAGFAQLVGVDLPTFEGQAAGQLLMEGLAILFLRKGMKTAA